MHQLLKLQHHRHTARRLPHHHTSYRGLLVVLISVGIALMMIQRASAEELVVTAKVPAEIPLSAAVITHPASGTVVHDRTIEVRGTCPITQPAVIVALWRGDELIGSTVCSPSGLFAMQVSLKTGNNIIVPKTTTVTYDKGPDGPAVNIIYQPLAALPPSTTVTPPGDSASGLPDDYQPPRLLTPSPFILFKYGQETYLNIVVVDGAPPYVLLVDWGDGTSSRLTLETAGPRQLAHTYEDKGKKVSSYDIRLKLTDHRGQEARLSVAAVTLALGGTALPPEITGSAGVLPGGTLTFVWATYGMAVGTMAFIWLLEHRLIWRLIVVAAFWRRLSRDRR